jgi:membrane-associated protease RseP (regulator of RpoE activity)
VRSRAGSYRRGWLISSALLLVTFVTTMLRGAAWEAPASGLPFSEILAQPALLVLGLPYSLSLLAILGTHEMGHYLACRRYGIEATPPYFLPSPPHLLFGTFGAFIRIRAPITNRRALFDIGVAGPLAGAAVAVPILLLGIANSGWQPDRAFGPGDHLLGGSLLVRFVVGWLAPPAPAPEGYTFVFGSLAMAGWVGFLATALNLLPVGQLDGGHIAYAISRKFHLWISRVSLGGFVVLGLLVNEAWLFWATLLIFFSPLHPRLIDEEGRLPLGRFMVAGLAGLLLLLSFVPDPIRVLT